MTTDLDWLPYQMDVGTLAECRCPECGASDWGYQPREPADYGEGPTWACPNGGSPGQPACPESALCRECHHVIESLADQRAIERDMCGDD